ncbi:MAG: ATP-grasp fold amidoligase family protein [Anderseniella sp.]
MVFDWMHLSDWLVVRLASFVMLARHWRAVVSFWNSIGRLPKLCPPESQNDKFLWRKLFDHNPAFETFCNKLASKKWAKERCPKLLVPETLWTGSSAADIPEHFFTQRVFVKANNGSSYNVRIEGTSCDRRSLEKLFDRWLVRPYGQRQAEWGYRNVPRKVFVEQTVGSAKGEPPVLVQVFAMAGKPVCAHCMIGWKDGERLGSFYSLSGERLSIRDMDCKPIPIDWQVPEGFQRAIEQSKLLVRNIDHVRCDLMCVDQQIWFSEMTPYSASGLERYATRAGEEFVYRNWDLRQSWFLTTPQQGWRQRYAQALLRLLNDTSAD